MYFKFSIGIHITNIFIDICGFGVVNFKIILFRAFTIPEHVYFFAYLFK